MTQLEYASRDVGRSQCARILARLQASAGKWVAMPELAEVASPSGDGRGLAVHARMGDLRRKGYFVAWKAGERKSDGSNTSFYMLCSTAEHTEAAVGECVAKIEN